LPLGSSSSVQDDAPVFVLGFPRQADLSSGDGIVRNRFAKAGRFQTTLPINFGDSGAPVFDRSGTVIGMAEGGQEDANLITYIIPSDLFWVLAGMAGQPLISINASDSPESGQIWKSLESNNDPKLIEAFIANFPRSPFRQEALARLDKLRAKGSGTPIGAETREQAACGGLPMAVSFGTRADVPLSIAEECALKIRHEFKECSVCPKMIVVPPGKFVMGSDRFEGGRSGDEGRQHVVTIDNPFAVGKYDITVEQFAAFVTDASYYAGSSCYIYSPSLRDTNVGSVRGYSWRNPGFSQSGSNPATCLNWNDAKAYVAWLSKTSKKDYRLLTEAEWEFSARGQTSVGAYPKYFFGNDESQMCRYGNGIDMATTQLIPQWSHGFRCWDGYAFTSPVDRFEANTFGLYDMNGNVHQWVEDCHHDTYAGAPKNGDAWIVGPCKWRVLRGGSWASIPEALRAAFRRRGDPNIRIAEFGFRVARTLAH
jgi:formylglycine-generating enzyme required for sulfatase activity